MSSSRGSILVVDDTAENLRLLVNMLGQHGYEVRPVTCGTQALQAAERSVPDVILLDINMPDMDGYEVCRQLKNRERLREVPVIFLTALTETRDKLQAFGVGGVDYISKPFQIDEVSARVKVHIELCLAKTELARNYLQLRELEKVRDSLFHMIVHDMRSPLAVIMANLDFLQAAVQGAVIPDATESLDDAMRGVKSLRGMTNDLLDVVKMEEGKLSLSLDIVDLTTLAREVVKDFSAMEPTRCIRGNYTPPAMARCDIGILRRVFENLLGNALKHTDAAAAVELSFEDSPLCIRVCIIDEGPGIPVGSREKIFEKFGALQAREQQKYHSVGLGLAFCKLAIEAHGGKIGVDSNEPRGSIFWFELPK